MIFRRKILSRITRIKKRFLQCIKPCTNKHKGVLFIVGCQRSGTTLMLRIFYNDLKTKIFPDKSKLSNRSENKIRLNPLHLVKKEFQRVRAPFIVLKPLVESQNILQLLEYFEGSKALWLFRGYQAVAASNLNRYGINSGISNLKPIVENSSDNWRSEKISDSAREVILRYYSETMNPHDAAVLFWFARNSIYFELGLDHNPNVILCKYEDLVINSETVMKIIYKTINQSYPGNKILNIIHSKSLNPCQVIKLTPDVELLAQRLMDKLDKIYSKKRLG